MILESNRSSFLLSGVPMNRMLFSAFLPVVAVALPSIAHANTIKVLEGDKKFFKSV